MKAFVTFSLICLATFTMVAQTTINGVVTDEEGESLVGANIYLEGTYDGTSSDLQGGFSLITEETGEQPLCCNKRFL